LSISIKDSLRKPIPCDGGFSDLLSINTDGVGVTCLMIDRSNESHGTKVEDLPLKSQWDEIQQKKNIMRTFSPNLQKCNTCSSYSICSSGCLVTAYHNGCLK
ncbi:MAG: SPASM domain-containing protein, partial [SAR324 cluster bacterium]|nr:SPASM domain-containing protein [SAR324 cluster bacterium]